MNARYREAFIWIQLWITLGTNNYKWSATIFEISQVQIVYSRVAYHNSIYSAEKKAKWHKAVLNEIQSLIENWTFELVATGCSKSKKNADGLFERYKACVIAHGFAQHPGFDYTEMFVPAPK